MEETVTHPMGGFPPSFLLYNTTVKLVELKPEPPFKYGTGFLFDFSDEGDGRELAIVTCRHVLKGIDDLAIRFSINSNGVRHPEKFNLRCANESVIWHPDPNVDLCAIPIRGIPESVSSKFDSSIDHIAVKIQDIPTAADISCMSALQDIVMVGYPIGLEDEIGNLPIARRGITATPYFCDYNGNPDFMLDIACFHGSSGSPVFLYDETITMLDDGVTAEHRVDRFKFLGIVKENRIEENKALLDGQVVENLTVNDPVNVALCVKAHKVIDLKPLLFEKTTRP